MVRMPVSKEILAIESNYWKILTKKIMSLAKTNQLVILVTRILKVIISMMVFI